MGLIAIIIISIIFGMLHYYIAGRIGSDKKFWFIMGFILGPLALPFIFLGKRKEHDG